MKQMKKKLFLFRPAGYSFLLTMLVVLVFVMFGVLSVSASLRDYEYSQRVAKKTTAYYAADTKASVILAKMDAVFASEDTLEDVLDSISEFPEAVVSADTEGAGVISYEVKMNEHQKLQIQLAVTEDFSGKAVYKIQKWQEVSSDSCESTTHLPVIGSK